MARNSLRMLALSVLLLFNGACDDGDETDITASGTNEAIIPIDCAAVGADAEISIAAGGFSPAAVTLASPAVVRWVNTDNVAHSVISGSPDGALADTTGRDTGDGTNIGDGTGTGAGDGGGIIGGIGGGPGLIAPVITPGALFNSGPLSTGQSFCLDLTNLPAAGDPGISYHCEIHPAETGRISLGDVTVE